MKKRFALLLALCLTLLLCACASLGSNTHIVEQNGVTYEIDTKACTISDDKHTYQYDYSPGKTSYTITITYPNGSTYAVAKSGHVSNSGHSEDYDPTLYADGETLIRIVDNAIHDETPSYTNNASGKIILVVILLGAGLFHFFFPQGAWYLSRGWWYKNAEPSDAALTWARISGAIYLLLAIIAALSPL